MLIAPTLFDWCQIWALRAGLPTRWPANPYRSRGYCAAWVPRIPQLSDIGTWRFCILAAHTQPRVRGNQFCYVDAYREHVSGKEVNTS